MQPDPPGVVKSRHLQVFSLSELLEDLKIVFMKLNKYVKGI